MQLLAPSPTALDLEIPHWLKAFTRQAEGVVEIVVYRSLQMREKSPRFEPVRSFLGKHEVTLSYREIVEDENMFLCKAEYSVYRILGDL